MPPADPLTRADAAVRTSHEAVLAWRVRRSLLVPAAAGTPAPPPTVSDVADRLVGVQAQVPSSARDAVSLRLGRDAGPELSATQAAGALLRTWAARGTLHLLTPSAAADQLAVLASARTWHKGSWQRTFATTAVMDRLAEVVPGMLAGAPLTREELVAAVVEATGDPGLAEPLGSGWSTLLKPLAWQGLLCQAPTEGGSARFTRPDLLVPGWRPAEVEAGAPRVVLAYLGCYGPARPEAFDAWLLRGATARARLRAWFADLADAGAIVPVDVEGERRWARTVDVDDLACPGQVPRVLLPAFDPYVLGPGAADPQVVPQEHRALVSRAGGWISPVILEAGRVAGVWSGEREDPREELFADLV